MEYKREYGGIIWTNHALERLKDRAFPQDKAWETIKYADIEKAGQKANTREFKKKFGAQTVTAIASKNEKGEWVVVSCWIDPPVIGTKDHYKKQKYWEYQKASNLKKIWFIILEQLGLR